MTRLNQGWLPKLSRHGARFPDVCLRTERLIIRPPAASDYRDWHDLRLSSRNHLVPYEPTWSPDHLQEDFFLRRIQNQINSWHLDQSRSFLIFTQDQNRLVGGMNINNIARGAAHFASLGYWLGAPYQGHGYMTETTRGILHYAFQSMNLHRMNAATLPHNQRSIAMLRRIGFAEEGFAKAYLSINGAWQDHVLFGLVNPTV